MRSLLCICWTYYKVLFERTLFECVGDTPTVCTYVMLLNAGGENGSVDVVSCEYVCVA